MKHIITALALMATPALSASYQIHDHPISFNNGFSHGWVNGSGRAFSFDYGDGAVLRHNETDGTAVLTGTMRESLGGGLFGDLYDITYNWTDVSATAGGGFQDTTCSGSGELLFESIDRGERIELGCKGTPAGIYTSFISLEDGFQLHGWTNSGDFIATASPIPLPAAVWLMIFAIGALRTASRRVKP